MSNIFLDRVNSDRVNKKENALYYTTFKNPQNESSHVLPMPSPECYIYLHHINTMIILPTYAEANSDGINVSFALNTPLMRTAPIYSYQNSGPRTLQVHFDLHRDLMYQLNYDNVPEKEFIDKSRLTIKNVNTGKDESYIDYVDIMAKYILAAALPTYSLESKMVNPPLVSLKLGNDIFIKGVVNGHVGISYGLPILSNGKYAKVAIDLSISEVVPYDATQVALLGSYRGIDTTLSQRNYYVAGSI